MYEDPVHSHKLTKLIDTENKCIQFAYSDAERFYVPPSARKGNNRAYALEHTDATEDEQSTIGWRVEIGSFLATSFNFPGAHKDWRIASFPRNYSFVESRTKTEGGKTKIQRRLYAGSYSKVFKSPQEFGPHAIWLLSQEDQQKSCQCKICNRSHNCLNVVNNDQGVLTGIQSATDVNSSRNIIRRQLAPRSECLPGVPLVSPSVCRINDLAKLDPTSDCIHEGFREGEVVFLTLSTPIKYLDGGQSKKIDSWPVLVREVGFIPQSIHQSASNKERVCVKQHAQYTVALLGSNEAVTVTFDRLLPALASPLLDKHFVYNIVTLQDVQSWMEGQKPKTLNIVNRKPRAADMHDIICAFISQLLILHQRRKQVELTDEFNHQSDWDKADKSKMQDVNLPAYVEQEKKNKKTVTFAQSDNAKGSSYAAVNANYTSLDDEDDSSARRRGEAQRELIGAAVENKGSDKIDKNKYWAGMFHGFERVWVGDVVRLNLNESDIRHVIDILVEHNDLSNPMDKFVPNLQSPVVLRIKAIFRTAEDSDVCIAGDLYRVVNEQDARRAFIEFNERNAKSQEQMHLNKDIQNSSGSTPRSHYQHQSSSTLSLESPETSIQPKYFLPCVSQLNSSKKGQLPPSPRLPDTFGFQKINSSNVEIVVGPTHIAGRMYCSLLTSKSNVETNAKLVRQVRVLQQSSNKSQDGSVTKSDRIQMCLAGLLPGFNLSMGIKYVQPEDRSKADNFEYTVAVAAATLKNHLQKVQIKNPDKLIPKRKLNETSAEHADECMKKSKSEQKDVRKREVVDDNKIEWKPKTDTDASTYSLKSDNKGQLSGNQVDSKPAQIRDQPIEEEEFKVYDAAPPGFVTTTNEKWKRLVYVNPNTRESVWGRKFVRK